MKKINWSTKNVILSKKLSVFGTLLLLLAFIVQTFLYNQWDNKVKIVEQAFRDYTEFTRTSLEYQNLYLGLEAQNDTLKFIFQPIFIKAAAEKYRLGRIISTNLDLFNNETDVRNFINNTNKLLLLINQVTDLNSLYQFVNEVEKLLPENRKIQMEWLDKMNTKKEIASLVFASLQLIGTIMIALGFKYQ